MQSARLPALDRGRLSSWLAMAVTSATLACSNGSTQQPVPGSGGSAWTGSNRGGSTSTGGEHAGGTRGSGGVTGGAGVGGNTASDAGATGGADTSGGALGTGGGVGTAGGAMTGGQSAGGSAAGGSAGGGAATGGVSATGGKTSGSAGGASGGSAAGGNSGSGGTSAGYHPCPTDTACKIMPFGDSITDGYNQDTPGGYRLELFKRAHADGKNITFVGSQSKGPSTVDGAAFPPKHEGHSGWTIYPETSGRYRDGISYCLSANTQNKCLATSSVMSEYKPDIVLLMIGTNDCIDSYDLSNAPKRLGDLIDTIYAQLPNVLIVVAQPIPSRGDVSKGEDAALSSRLKTYGDAIPAIVKPRADAGKHIMTVDMYAPFNSNKTSLLEDEWHPNLAGYAIIGDQWYLALKPLL